MINFWLSPGSRLTGHEFHRTTLEPTSTTAAAWLADGEPVGFSADPAGIGRKTLHASYLHLHWAGHPELAQRFADAVHDHASALDEPSSRSSPPRRSRHRRRPGRPGCQCPPLCTAGLARDDHQRHDRGSRRLPRHRRRHARPSPPPTASPLIRYCRPPEAAEAFTLLARAFRPEQPVIIHPQFTEPEAALIAAGHRPERLILSPATDFTLDTRTRCPQHADLIMIGNPTNPTSVLHPAAADHLIAPTRTASSSSTRRSWTACPGRPRRMIGDDMTGLLVLRSLTKTWGLAGLRAGYVIGDRALIAAMQRQQPPWSVSTPALAAMVACLTPEARIAAAEAAIEIAAHRAYLVDQLAQRRAHGRRHGPQASVRPGRHQRRTRPSRTRLAPARACGTTASPYAAARPSPALTPDWIRIAVREPDDHRPTRGGSSPTCQTLGGL